MLKIEPTSLHNCLVVSRNDRSIEGAYSKIEALLKKHKKEEAVKIATTFINDKLNIPKELTASNEKILQEFQSVRL